MLAVRWLFPGKTVHVDAPCLDCGEPIAIEMRDEQLLSTHPEGIVGCTNTEFPGAVENRPTM